MGRHNPETGHNSGRAEGGRDGGKVVELSATEQARADRIERDSFAVNAPNRPSNPPPGRRS